MQKVLVYLDEEDMYNWNKLEELRILYTEDSNTLNKDNYLNAKKNFWSYLLDKYGALRNKQIFLEAELKCVFDISGRI